MALLSPIIKVNILSLSFTGFITCRRKTQWKTGILSREDRVRLALGRRVSTWNSGCPVKFEFQGNNK